MATTFLEPGGDANFLTTAGVNGFWTNASGTTPAIATDFVHGTHVNSIKPAIGAASALNKNAVLADAGTRISLYVYFNALPTAATTIIRLRNGGGTSMINLKITPAGVMQLFETTAQIGTDGLTLSTGVWYRICLAYTITNSTTNRFEVFLDAASSISVTNATLTNTGSSTINIGNVTSDVTSDYRFSDIYIDNLSSLVDTGNIWVTAKRPNANGTANGFTTQIGAGGSGYGSGHSPQVNERPLSITDGWSIIGAGSAVTEEYNVEGKATGDINISAATIIDYVGWISTKALAAETVNIIVNGVNFAQAITTSNTLYTKVAGSSTYPAGTGADIGETTDTSLTTVSLYECGILVAFIPGASGGGTGGLLSLMGVGV